jgi:hypothetical protein
MDNFLHPILSALRDTMKYKRSYCDGSFKIRGFDPPRPQQYHTQRRTCSQSKLTSPSCEISIFSFYKKPISKVNYDRKTYLQISAGGQVRLLTERRKVGLIFLSKSQSVI